MDMLDLLVEEDQMLDAWQIVQEVGPLAQWQAGEARRMASLLAYRLGGGELSGVLDYLNYRHDRNHPNWTLRYQYVRLGMVSPVEMLPQLDDYLKRFVGRMDETQAADFHLIKSILLSSLSDHDEAKKQVKLAHELVPDYSWGYVRDSAAYEAADEYEKADELADRALELRPYYHAAVLQKVGTLTHLGKDDEAMELLHRAHDRAQHGVYVGRLQMFYSERDDHEKALWCLDELEKLSPLLGEKQKKWLAGRRGDFQIIAGRMDEARANLAKSESKYHEYILEKLTRDGADDMQRKRLDVPFVRQHDMTCAPATLAAISAYWGEDKNHLEIADAICYDGTPWHKERNWSRDQGYVTRNFNTAWDTAKTLIDRGVPFTLTTSWVTGAHLQACVGYDERTGILIIRDPTHRHFVEMVYENLVEAHPVRGLRGMLMVPQDKAHLVSDLILEDEHLYEAFCDLNEATEAHDDMKMRECLSVMRAIDSKHPMVIMAESYDANYRKDGVREMSLVKALHERFPKDETWRYRYYVLVREYGSYQEAYDLIDEVVKSGKCDPIFFSEFGDLLTEDLASLDLAKYYLLKSAKRTGNDSRSLSSLSRCEYLAGETDRSLRYIRFASCKAGGFEGYARAYFSRAWQLDKTDEALEYLQRRVDNYGKKDSASWVTLAESYEKLGRRNKAKEIYQKAIELFPDDGELLLSMSHKVVFWSGEKEAISLLDKAQGKVKEEDWHLYYAQMAAFAGDRLKSMRHYRKVIDLNPRNIDALHSYTQLLSQEYGEEKALEYAQEQREKSPNNVAVLVLCAEWEATQGAGKSLDTIQSILDLEPNHQWALREQAIRLEEVGQREKSLEVLELCVSKQPNNEDNLLLMGQMLASAGRNEEAISYFKKTLSLQIDYVAAAAGWMSLLDDQSSRKAALAFMEKELEHQVSTGTFLLYYRAAAFPVYDHEVLLARLKGYLRRYQYEWEAWSAVKDQLLAMQRNVDALLHVQRMAEKLPLYPRTWVEVAEVRRDMGQSAEEIAALKKALEMSPAWDWVARKLAETLEWEGRYEEAAEVLQNAIRWQPLAGPNYGLLANMLYNMGKKEKAFDVLKDCLQRDASYDWGWRQLASWSLENGRRTEVEELMAIHQERKSHMTAWWEIVFSIYEIYGELEKAEQACDAALEVDPTNVDLLDMKAYFLGTQNKLTEALELIAPERFPDGKAPSLLVVRKARLLWEYGRSKEAFTLLEDLVSVEEANVNALRFLTDWYVKTDKWAAAREACDKWLRYQPDFPVVWGQKGIIEEQLNHPEEAYRCFRKAFEISNEYTFAAYRAFELGMKLERYDEVEVLLGRVRHYSPGAMAYELEMQFYHHQKKYDDARRSFELLIEAPDATSDQYDKCLKLMGEPGRGILVHLVEEGRAGNQEVIRVWLWGRSEPVKLAKLIEALPYDLEMKSLVWSDYWEWLQKSAEDKVLLKVLKSYPHVTKITQIWGTVGWTLGARGLFKEAVAILKDYKDRKDVEAWMLVQLCHGMTRFHGSATSLEIHDYALNSLPPDGARNRHLAYYGLSLAIAGRDDEARHVLEDNYSEFNGTENGVRELAKLVLNAQPGTKKAKLGAYWLRFSGANSDWSSVPVIGFYLEEAKKAVKKRKAQWSWKWKLKKAEGPNDVNVHWLWVVIAFIIIKVLIRAFN